MGSEILDSDPSGSGVTPTLTPAPGATPLDLDDGAYDDPHLPTSPLPGQRAPRAAQGGPGLLERARGLAARVGRVREPAVRRTVLRAAALVAAGALVAGAIVHTQADASARRRAEATSALSFVTSWTGGGEPGGVEPDVVDATISMAARVQNYGPVPVRLVGVEIEGNDDVRVSSSSGLDASAAPGRAVTGSFTLGVRCRPDLATSPPGGRLVLVARTRDGESHRIVPSGGGAGGDDLPSMVAAVCSSRQDVGAALGVGLDRGALLITWDPRPRERAGQSLRVSTVNGLDMVSRPALPAALPTAGHHEYRVTPVVRRCTAEMNDPTVTQSVGQVSLSTPEGPSDSSFGATEGFQISVGRAIERACGGR